MPIVFLLIWPPIFVGSLFYFIEGIAGRRSVTLPGVVLNAVTLAVSGTFLRLMILFSHHSRL